MVTPATIKSPAGLKVAPTPVGSPTLIPFLAVISPVESTFVTSSYVRVPPIDKLPLIVAPTATIPPYPNETPIPVPAVSVECIP